MSDTSLIFNFLAGRNTASPEMKKLAGDAEKMAAKIKAASSLSGFGIGTLVSSIAGLVAEAVSFTDAVAPMIGVLAAIPAFSYAAAFSLAPLIVSFLGIGAALKSSASSGGGSADRIVQAEHRIAQAQQASVDAQKALTDARETASKKLRDLSLQLQDANIAEAESQLAVRDAQLALNQARRTGDPLAIAHAQLALQQAQVNVAQSQNRVSDTQEELTKRQQKGVEGSDEVQQALRQQAEATYNLAEAQKALTSGGGGTNAAAIAYAKLSTAGKQLVDVLKSLGPKWHEFQRGVQQSTLAGVASSVAALAAVWLPLLQARLGEIGAAWNTAIRGFATLFTAKGTVKDLNTVLQATAAAGRRLALSLVPFFDGFNQFAVAGAGFLPRFGDYILNIAQRFDAWATNARNTGKAQAWIQNALTAFHQFWDLTKEVSKAVAAIFKAGSGGPQFLPHLIDATKAAREFLQSTQGQGQMAQFWATLRDLWSAIWGAAKPLFAILVQSGPTIMTITGAFNILGVAIRFLADHMGLVNKLLPPILTLFLTYKTTMIAMRLATMAWSIVTGVATAAQWLLNIAMDANPIGLIILGIIALIAIIIVLIKYHKQIGHFFVWVWGYIWDFLKGVGHWFAHDFVDFFKHAFDWIIQKALEFRQWQIDILLSIVDFFRSLPGRIKNAVVGLWDSIVDSFKASLNHMIRLWNDFHLTLGGGTVLGVDIPSVTLDTPNLPYLAHGGIVPATPGGRLIVAGEGGQDEAVVPLPSGGLGSGATEARVVVDSGAGDQVTQLLLYVIRRLIREGKLRIVVSNGQPRLAL